MQTFIEDTGFAVLLSLLPEATIGIFPSLEMLCFVKCRGSQGNVILNMFFPMIVFFKTNQFILFHSYRGCVFLAF